VPRSGLSPGGVFIRQSEQVPPSVLDQRHEQPWNVLRSVSSSVLRGGEELQAVAFAHGDPAPQRGLIEESVESDWFEQILNVHIAKGGPMEGTRPSLSPSLPAVGGLLVFGSRRELLVLYWGW
jgi:hypothetical protein